MTNLHARNFRSLIEEPTFVLELSSAANGGYYLVDSTGHETAVDIDTLSGILDDPDGPIVLVRDLTEIQPLLRSLPAESQDRLLDVHIIDRVLGTDLRTHAATQMMTFTHATLDAATTVARDRIVADHQLAQLLMRRANVGYLVDRNAIEVVLADADRRLDDLRSVLLRSGREPFNPRSKLQLDAYCAAVGAAPGADRDITLARLAEDPRIDVHETAVLLARFFDADAQAAKLRNVDRHLTVDDRVHPTVDVAGTVTGRVTYKAPALPNLAEEMRYVMLVPPGQVLISADLDQIELRVAAALSQDERLINDVVVGDFHQRAAESIFRRTPTAGDRAVAKQVVYAVLYGGGDDRLALTAGLSATDARALRDNFLASYPDLGRWAQETIRSDRIVTQFGRLVRYERGHAYKLVNHLLQATARDLFADMILAAQRAGLEVWLPLHDEIIISAPRPQAAESQQRLLQVMSTTFSGVPITAKSRVLGARWGALPV